MTEEPKSEIKLDWSKYQEYRKHTEKIEDDKRKAEFDPKNEKGLGWKDRLKNRAKGALGLIFGSAALASYGVPGLGPVVQGIATTTIVFSTVSNIVGQIPFFIKKQNLLDARLAEKGKPIKSSLLAGTRGMIISPILAVYKAGQGTYQKIKANRITDPQEKAELENKSQNSFHEASGYAKVFGVVVAAPVLFTAGCFEQMIKGTKHTKLGVIAAMKSAGASFRKSNNDIKSSDKITEFQAWLKYKDNKDSQERTTNSEKSLAYQKDLSQSQTPNSEKETQPLVENGHVDNTHTISWIKKVEGEGSKTQASEKLPSNKNNSQQTDKKLTKDPEKRCKKGPKKWVAKVANSGAKEVRQNNIYFTK